MFFEYQTYFFMKLKTIPFIILSLLFVEFAFAKAEYLVQPSIKRTNQPKKIADKDLEMFGCILVEMPPLTCGAVYLDCLPLSKESYLKAALVWAAMNARYCPTLFPEEIAPPS